MKPTDDIQKELLEIAPTLAAVKKQNAYSVPEGYFERFAADMLRLTTAYELETIAPLLLKVEKPAVADVPQNYFESFSAGMLKKIHEDELQAVAPVLSAMEKQNTVAAPEHYFASFPQKMLAKIADAEPAASKAKPYSVLSRIDVIIEDVIGIFFKPKYAVAFAGAASTVIVAAVFFMQVQQQCTDLDCKMAKLTDQELSDYFDKHSSDGLEEIFESNDAFEIDSNSTVLDNGLKNISDEELDNALLD